MLTKTDKPAPPSPDSHLEQIEKREKTLWRHSVLILFVLAVGLAITSWEALRRLPLRLEALPIGLVVLVVLFGAYAWRQRHEIGALRAFVHGLREGASAPPSDQQIEKLLDVVARSQHGYRELIDSLDHVIFNLSLDGEIKVVNRRFADFVGVPFTEIIHHQASDFFLEPDAKFVKELLPEFLEKRVWNGVVRVRFRRTGEVRYFDIVLQPIVAENIVVAVSGIARDVTSQRETEVRFSELFESLQEGVYFSRPDGVLLEVNPAFVQMLGFSSKAEALAIDVRDIYDDPQDRAWKIRELQKSGVIRSNEVTLVRKDGKKLRCIDSCSGIRDNAGHIVQIQGAIVDITDRVEIERRLHQEQEFGRRLVECFPDVIVALDAQGQFTFVSPRCQDLVGVTAVELVGRKVGERAHPEDVARVERQFANLISGATRSERLEYRIRREDDTWRTIRVSASPLMDSDSRTMGVVASVRDVTEEKQFERQIIQSERFAAMGQMLAGVAHELNNPLTAILGVSDLLHDRADSDSMRRQTEIVHKQARRAADIVQSLLAFSHRSAPGRTQVKVQELVHRALQLHAATLTKKHIVVDFRAADDLPPIDGDASLLLQVFLNLAMNAEQAISAANPQGGRIQISAIRLEDKVVVSVDDSGPGIPADIVSKVFDPFFTTKRPGGGSGLGLTISLAIVREHGGTIEIHSMPTRGASVRVILPASQSRGIALPSSNTSEPSRQVIPSLRGKSILVVDDEDGIRELVSEGLAARGMAVETVATCEEALTILGLRQFDVILCDYNLPGLNGEELFSRLSVSSGGIASRFVFMTGDLLDSEAHASFSRRGVRALQKPFQLSGLAGLLSEVLEAQHAQTT